MLNRCYKSEEAKGLENISKTENKKDTMMYMGWSINKY